MTFDNYRYKEYKSDIWETADWGVEKLRIMLDCCEKFALYGIETPGLLEDDGRDYWLLMNVIAVKLMVLEADFSDFSKHLQMRCSANELYQALHDMRVWCRYNRESICRWVLDIPDECMRELSPECDALNRMAAEHPEIDMLMEDLELSVEDEQT